MVAISSGAVQSYLAAIEGILSGHVPQPYIWPLSLIIAMVVFAIALILTASIFGYLIGWIERKYIARMQSRHGPTYVGKYGVLQNLADLIKLISKENIVPHDADRPLFLISIPMMVAAFVMTMFFIPLTSSFVGIDTSIALIVVFMIISFIPLAIFTAGWSSANKFASIGAERSVAMLISYEIPLLLVIVAVAMMANSYSFYGIISAQQSHWFALLMPIGLVIFFVVMLAELERPPFDLREADSELIAGWLTDVSAPYYALVLFMDYARVFVGSLLITVLFFGGFLGPSVIPPFAWTMIKVTLIALFIIVIRATTVRMRIDRVLRLGWLYMTPLAVVNLLLTFILFIH
ncbi:MAG: NADH-quinone oxidoreductase subunit H [Candidatus Marsarchaeota archaeon]|jgi:NADH-quinone oxidoreductase subunit H|nr:NADH-quinone oxidoreductase subunit H [Candidatus Marsarchaeota archaeon]MCL5111626.1 NADH-quinone oxidoreductase subunit H [Candidatus Marsarchaeota archaeon]